MICTVVIEKEDDIYIARDIKTGTTDEGYTIAEALKRLKEALGLYYDVSDIDFQGKFQIKTMTIDLDLPIDVAEGEEHAELVNNRLIVEERVSVPHNNAVLAIVAVIKKHIKESDIKDRVFAENVALYCDELCAEKGNLLLPDVMIVHEGDGFRDDGIHTAPVFVAEVTSESTRRNDYGRKMLIYRDIGVQEYWVIDLDKRAVVRYLADNDFVPDVITYEDAQVMPMSAYPGIEINLADVFSC